MVEPVSPARINFGWLVRLRFATVAKHAVTSGGQLSALQRVTSAVFSLSTIPIIFSKI